VTIFSSDECIVRVDTSTKNYQRQDIIGVPNFIHILRFLIAVKGRCPYNMTQKYH